MTHSRSLFTSTMIAAATVVVAAGAASAQPNPKAEIPFSFRAGEKVFAAGTYRITTLDRQSGPPIFRIAGEDPGTTILVMPHSATGARKAWQETGDPVLAFRCTESRCALAELWAGYGEPAYILYRPKVVAGEPTRLVAVSMRPARTD